MIHCFACKVICYVSTVTKERQASETVSTTKTDKSEVIVDEVFTHTAEPKSYFELIRNKSSSSHRSDQSSRSSQFSPKSADLSPKSLDISTKSSNISPKSVDKSWSSDSKSPRSAISDNSKLGSSKPVKGEKTKIDLSSVSEAVRRDAKFSSGKFKTPEELDLSPKSPKPLDDQELSPKSPKLLDDPDPEQPIISTSAVVHEGTLTTGFVLANMLFHSNPLAILFSFCCV